MNFIAPFIIGAVVGGLLTYAWAVLFDLPMMIIKENHNEENPLQDKVDSLHQANIAFRKELDDLKVIRAPKAPDEDRAKLSEVIHLYDRHAEEVSKKVSRLENELQRMNNRLQCEFNKFTYSLGKDFLKHVEQTQSKLDGLSQYNRHSHFNQTKNAKPVREKTAEA